MFSLGPRSKMRLQGVHPDLVKVVERAIQITTVDFTVLEGVRDPQRQRTLVESGASQTMNSRHIPGADGFAKAVDLGAWVDDQVDWSWPLYNKIAAAMKEAAKQVKVPIEWGGDWKTFKDGPHFQLSRKEYP
jgi:peptidoglycan L-alanyl-D-glutamate endopeptidase CwlK